MSLGSDVRCSIEAAAKNNIAFEAELAELRQACGEGRWDEIEKIRERLLAAVDGYVDHYAAACRRLEASR